MIRDHKNERYFDVEGSFNFPSYLYDNLKELMKLILDQGNMAISDQRKLRSFKEQSKKAFYGFWFDLATILEQMEVIEPCGCDPRGFCDICRGSRYRLGCMLSPQEVKEVCTFLAGGDGEETVKKLRGKQAEVENLLNLIREWG